MTNLSPVSKITALPGFVLLPLNQNEFAIIDAEDKERVIKLGKWRIDPGHISHSTHKNINGKRTFKIFLLHRFILNVPKGLEVDHINGNILDNRKSNLRTCTHAQNSKNAKRRKDNTSGFKGVWFKNEKWRKKQWVANIDSDNRHIYLGHYITAREAAIAYNDAARKYHGEFARLNIL